MELTRASAQATTELDGYDLLVSGSPTYWLTPSLPVRRYLQRLGALAGQPTLTIFTGLGAGGCLSELLHKQVREAGGNLVTSLALHRMQPNDDDNYVDAQQNQALAVEMAEQAARSLALAGE